MGLLKDNKLKEVLKVSDVAGKELSIEQTLDKMMNEWAHLELDIVSYRATGTFVIKVLSELVPAAPFARDQLRRQML
jgi:dynein heavy chain, axonemal